MNAHRGPPAELGQLSIIPPSQMKRSLDFYLNYNQCMKKLLLLLILSFFSVQSIAGSCPDGSEPVKSISADGTYFVYNCGGSSSVTDSTNASSNIKALAGIDIENDPEKDFFRAPMTGYWNFQIKEAWATNDFNNDGYVDFIYVGGMKF